MTQKAKKARRDMHAEITARMVAELKGGTIPWLKPWKSGGSATGFSGMPRNAVSKRAYSGINVLLLWCEAQDRGYSSAEWLTFKQAKERGGTVRKGEKGVEIIFMRPLDVKDREDPEQTKRILMLRSYHVFNVEQCDGLKLKDVRTSALEPKATESGLNARFMADVKRTGIEVRHGGNVACYSPTFDRVDMPTVAQFVDCQAYQAVLAHELVHATGHKSRLDRWSQRETASGTKQEYAFEELIAEMGAAFVCAEYGFRAELRHASYIGGWIKALENDKGAVVMAASKASKAVAYLFPHNAEAIDNEEKKAA